MLVKNSSNGLYFPSYSSFLPTRGVISQWDIDRLRRPSQFIGLEDVYKKFNTTHTRNFTNYPIVLAPIDSSKPFQTFGSDPKSRRTSIGTISQEKRQLHISDTISTVVQFRALDFGMENCELAIRMDLKNMNTSPAFHSLDLFTLEGKFPLRTHQLSYKNRPSRIQKIAEISELKDGYNVLYKFHCNMDGLFTFELTCSQNMVEARSCDLEWWQDRENPNPG
ncbi:hypothetical protein BDQ17DRAFT_1258389 [Cyathus striatus]|nr:hypothetical protein BDQ17DRAFT_1258389 [Cyathus striatus]